MNNTGLLLVATFSFLILNCTSPSNKSYNIPEKKLNENEVNLYIEKVNKEFTTPGFKGIHLSMNHDQVNKLVKHTFWAYKYRSNKEENEPDYDNSVVMGKELRTGPSNFDSIGCYGKEKVYCHYTEGVHVKYYDDKVVSIAIEGIMLSANEIDLRVKEWGKFALQGLKEKYGNPTTIIKNVDNINIFDFKSGYSTPLYIWDFGENRIKLTIEQSQSKFGCTVYFENKDGINKIRERESVKKPSF
jgi:hypothetical protein